MPVPENAPRRAGRSRSIAPAAVERFPTRHVVHCHFASQDRNASPKKAGGAVNREPSNKQEQETRRPGPAVRDFGKIAFAQFWIRVSGVSRHGMRPKIGKAESLTAKHLTTCLVCRVIPFSAIGTRRWPVSLRHRKKNPQREKSTGFDLYSGARD